MLKVIYAGVIPETDVTVKDILSRDSVKKFLFQLYKKPRSKEQIFAENLVSIDDFNDLYRNRIIDSKDGLFYPTFPIFTEEEVSVLEHVATEMAVRIGNVIKGQWPDIHSYLEKITPYQIFDKPLMTYFILGSFILDVAMKKYLSKKGLLVIPSATPQGYIYFGIDVKASFAVLHDTTKVEIAKHGAFISFGKDLSGLKDITAIRKNLEKALKSVVSGKDSVNFYSLIRHYIQSMFDDMSAVMSRVIYLSEDWDRLRSFLELSELHFWDLIDFMEQMGYVESFPGKVKGKVPVFLPSDTSYLSDLAAYVGELVTPTFEAVISTYWADLSSILSFQYPTINDMWIYYLMWLRCFPRILEYLEREGILAFPEEGYVKGFIKMER